MKKSDWISRREAEMGSAVKRQPTENSEHRRFADLSSEEQKIVGYLLKCAAERYEVSA